MSRGSYVKVNELLADYDSYTTVNNCDDNESKSQINSISDCFNYQQMTTCSQITQSDFSNRYDKLVIVQMQIVKNFPQTFLYIHL